MQVVEGLLCAGPVLGARSAMSKIKPWSLFARSGEKTDSKQTNVTSGRLGTLVNQKQGDAVEHAWVLRKASL